MVMKKFRFGIVVLAMSCVARATVWLRYPNDRGPAAVQAGSACLQTVAEKFFYDPYVTRSKNMVILHTSNMSAPAAEIGGTFLSLMHEVIAEGVTMKNIQLRVISDSYIIDGIINVDPNAVTLTDYYVLVTDDLKKFKSTMQEFVSRASAYNPAGRFLILFNNPDFRHNATNSGELLAELFFRLMYDKFSAANVVFCYATSIQTYSLFITDPYRNPETCGTLKAILVDTCNNGLVSNADRTTKWLRDSRVPESLPGCKFTLCARVTEPYVEPGCHNGLEMEIMKILQDIMQFDLKLICKAIPRGEPLDNGSWTNLLGMLRNGECDFVVGGFFPDNDVHDDFGVTSPYLQDTYTWYVALAKLSPPWQGLIQIFQPITWLLFVLILLVAAFAWYIFGVTMPEAAPHRKVAILMMNTWCVFLGISANNRPDFTPLRVFFILLALYGLNVTTIYTSKLINVFTEPNYEPQIDTISKIIITGQMIGGREEYKDWFDNDNPDDNIVTRNYRYTDRFQPTTDNLKLVRDGMQAMLINRFYVLSNSLRDAVYAVPGNVFSSPLEMITERGFPLLKKFNRLINYMKDAGLIHKINRDFIFNMSILERIKYREHIEDYSQIVLTVEHLEGAFAVLIVGAIISIVVFMGEIISATDSFKRSINTIEAYFSNKWYKMMVRLKLQEPQAKFHKRY